MLFTSILCISADTTETSKPNQNSTITKEDKEEYEKLPLNEKFRVKAVGTMKAAGLMWLPILSCTCISLLILGNTFESMSRLTMLSYKLMFFAGLGFFLMLFAEPISNIITTIAERTDPTL